MGVHVVYCHLLSSLCIFILSPVDLIVVHVDPGIHIVVFSKSSVGKYAR